MMFHATRHVCIVNNIVICEIPILIVLAGLDNYSLKVRSHYPSSDAQMCIITLAIYV